MIAAIIRQLTRDMSIDDVKRAGFDTYFVDHTGGVWPQAASGTPFSATAFQSKGDAITDLFEDLAAEQKARTTYDNILRLVDIPDVREPIKFLRQREVTHFQRFGEANLADLSKYCIFIVKNPPTKLADKRFTGKGVQSINNTPLGVA